MEHYLQPPYLFGFCFKGISEYSCESDNARPRKKKSMWLYQETWGFSFGCPKLNFHGYSFVNQEIGDQGVLVNN